MAKRRAARERQAAIEARRQRRRMMLIAGSAAVVAVAALILAGGLFRGGDNPPAQRVAPATGLTLGSPDAAVVIDAWEDFQCPVCKAANDSVLKRIEDNYVETGQAALRFRQFPFLGQESYAAAEASLCANEQDSFWPYHDALFAAQAGENRGAFSSDKLKELAVKAGLDVTAFETCMAADSTLTALQSEKKEGERLGVNATPTFFVNGTKVKDWRDYDAFASLIEDALKSAEAQ